MSKIPPAIDGTTTIGYRDYTVTLMHPHAKGDKYGFCDTQEGVIALDPDMHADERTLANTFLHEVLHGAYFENGLHTRIGNVIEEDIVRSMTDSLCLWARANPKQAQWVLNAITQRGVK